MIKRIVVDVCRMGATLFLRGLSQYLQGAKNQTLQLDSQMVA